MLRLIIVTLTLSDIGERPIGCLVTDYQKKKKKSTIS